MSQTTPETNAVDRDEDDRESDPEPEIEEDLVSEELRIDGICGVY